MSVGDLDGKHEFCFCPMVVVVLMIILKLVVMMNGIKNFQTAML